MKKLLISFLFILIIIFSVTTIISDTQKHEIVDLKNPTQYSSKYKIMDYNGKIGVFKTDSEVPIKIYNVYLESLPESDKKLLKEGITCADDAELQRLIEDYTS